jgi:hypothetical protein
MKLQEYAASNADLIGRRRADFVAKGLSPKGTCPFVFVKLPRYLSNDSAAS